MVVGADAETDRVLRSAEFSASLARWPSPLSSGNAGDVTGSVAVMGDVEAVTGRLDAMVVPYPRDEAPPISTTATPVVNRGRRRTLIERTVSEP